LGDFNSAFEWTAGVGSDNQISRSLALSIAIRSSKSYVYVFVYRPPRFNNVWL